MDLENRIEITAALSTFAVLILSGVSICCGGSTTRAEGAAKPAACRQVGVIQVAKKNLQQQLTVSSELVPFQQIDLYAKEAGYVRKLNVDFGTHVKTGDVMAVLEIPELQMQLEEDDADLAEAASQVGRMQKELERVKAQRDVAHLQFTRLDTVAKEHRGLVAQQEVDDAQGKALSSQAQVDAAEAALLSAQSQVARATAKKRRDQAIFAYSNIVAPFSGVVTQRYANFGTLMQSGTNSSTSVLPLVQLSEDDKFRLVIPVPEKYVRYIRIGDPVDVTIPALNGHFPGRVARFSVDVKTDTRTMHTEVDVPNPSRKLMPGLYAEAKVRLDRRESVIAAPVQAVDVQGEQRTVWVVDSSNRVESRAVTLGIETPEDAEVLSGLRDGELVVVGDRSALKSGETVCPKQVQLLQYRGQ